MQMMITGMHQHTAFSMLTVAIGGMLACYQLGTLAVQGMYAQPTAPCTTAAAHNSLDVSVARHGTAK